GQISQHATAYADAHSLWVRRPEHAAGDPWGIRRPGGRPHARASRRRVAFHRRRKARDCHRPGHAIFRIRLIPVCQGPARHLWMNSWLWITWAEMGWAAGFVGRVVGGRA